MEIDLVYLWVDGNDPVWRAKHNAYIGNTETATGVNCKGRYADNDELKYSLRSIEMYAPWIRQVFIVTDNQTPIWLDTSNPKVKIVDHREIMPQTCLPCFNSTVIEHFLYRIPGLSEHFIYANDDMFINKPVRQDFFFTSDGLPIIRMNRRPFRRLTLLLKERVLGKKISNYVLTIHNSAKLVEREYGIYYNGKTHHNIDSYLKSNCQHVWEVFKDDIQMTLSNHIRSENDIQRNIYSYVPLAEKLGHLEYVSQKTSFRLHIDNEKQYQKLERYNPVLFCMNDSEYADDDDRQKSMAFLNKRFPKKSLFEK